MRVISVTRPVHVALLKLSHRILGKVERLPGRSRIGETGVTTYFLQDPSPFYCTVSKLITITTFDIVLENESVALAKIVRRLEIREEDEF